MLGDRTVGREEPLGVARGLKALHAPLPLASWLVRILRAIIQIPVLTMFDLWEELALSGTITLEFIGDDDPRHVHQAFEQLDERLPRLKETASVIPC
jgi:hypothetical protein